MQAPMIGITIDNRENRRDSGRYEIGTGYSEAVAAAGGMPVILPHEIRCVAAYAARCHGFLFTGGVDPDTTVFGQPVHRHARLMDPARQAFELALFDAIAHRRPTAPVLGICLGMQLMALRAGGRLDQHLPDTQPTAVVARHRQAEHTVTVQPACAALPAAGGTVHSHHRQAVAHPGTLRIIARAEDRLIEAIDDPTHPFYLGVQWHPERRAATDPGPLNGGLFRSLVQAASEQAAAEA